MRDAYYLPLVEFLFEGAEQAFDPAVLPRASGVGALVADAEHLQANAKLFGGKYSFVVGTDDFWFTVSTNDFTDASEQDMRRFFVQRTKMQ